MRGRLRRGCLGLLLVLAVTLLIGGVVLYLTVIRGSNLRPALSPSGAVALHLPPGFEANIFAEGLDGPRFLAFGPEGVLHVADRGNDRLVALPDMDRDGRADEIQVFAGDLNRPHSLAYQAGAWYVGVPSGVIRLEDSDGDGQADVRDAIIDDIPDSGQHRTRTVAFLPDGRLVLSIGSSCNVCDEEDPRRAAVVIYDGPEGTGERIFANGLRNAVGLAVNPASGELWATNNGRDFMGDDLPPDTVDVVREGADYGWPRCHAGDVIDPDFGGPGACDGVNQPLAKLQAHSAPLGLVFYTGRSFPSEYWGDLFIAYHGSWNRSVPTGYKVVRLPLDGSQLAGPVEDFATGWLDEESNRAEGRPVGLAVSPTGDLFVSDDKGGFIYRISYQGAGS